LVVSDTSPLTNLAAIGHFDLLQKLYGALLIAGAVWDELNAEGRHWPGRNEVAAASWIERRVPSDRLLAMALNQDLDLGEAESIALALEFQADLILLDERDGRHKAMQFGLRPVGVVGVLLTAKARGHVAAIEPLLLALRQQAGFYLGDSVYREALRIAQEFAEPG
jgi:predicted nucleic acid-binding protein